MLEGTNYEAEDVWIVLLWLFVCFLLLFKCLCWKDEEK